MRWQAVHTCAVYSYLSSGNLIKVKSRIADVLYGLEAMEIAGHQLSSLMDNPFWTKNWLQRRPECSSSLKTLITSHYGWKQWPKQSANDTNTQITYRNKWMIFNSTGKTSSRPLCVKVTNLAVFYLSQLTQEAVSRCNYHSWKCFSVGTERGWKRTRACWVLHWRVTVLIGTAGCGIQWWSKSLELTCYPIGLWSLIILSHYILSY